MVVLAEAAGRTAPLEPVGFGLQELVAITDAASAQATTRAPVAQAQAAPATAAQRHLIKAGAAVVAPACVAMARLVLEIRSAALGVVAVVAPEVLGC